MHYIRRGAGKPLLLVHGLGGSWRSWQRITDRLAQEGRDVIAVNLPGHGNTPPLPGENSIRTLADALTEFLTQHRLLGIDAVGSSMGARIVLELARRGGVLGAVVALDPGGFWEGWEVPAFYYSLAGSVRLVRLIEPILPLFTSNPLGRTALFAQFSACPWAIPSRLAIDEMRTFGLTRNFDELLHNLAFGEPQQGAPAGSIKEPLVIGWGTNDLVCLPRQAARAQQAFPDAQIHWFPNCGHFPQWDVPDQAVSLILAATSGQAAKTVPIRPRAIAHTRLNWAAALGTVLAVAGASLFLSRGRL